MDMKNPLVTQLTARLRARRMLVPEKYGVKVRSETTAQGPHSALWFRTRGCTNDRLGQCTMCNFGASDETSGETMVRAVRWGLRLVRPDDRLSLFVSPSGSMFDDAEVPEATREAIFGLLRQFPCRAVQCESRPETLTEARLDQFRRCLPDKRRSIGMGLESATPWVMKYALNKCVRREEFTSAVDRIHASGAQAAANVMVGVPFLTPAEAIADAVLSAQWALDQGSDLCLLFPLHVKRWTFVDWLASHELYASPSLWSLAEVLGRLGPAAAPRLRIAWHKNRFAERDREEPGRPRVSRLVEDVVVRSPTTCPECYDAVIALFDELRVGVTWETIVRLQEYSCRCKDEWRATLAAVAPAPIAARLRHAYELAARDLLPAGAWEQHQATAVDERDLPNT